jgi:beta-glucosidase
VNYCNGADAVMAGGVTTCDAMLWYVTQQLPNYENDAVIVTAMREACHHNLYALVNSSAMNGIGADTVIIPKEPAPFLLVRILAIVTGALFILAVVFWCKGKKKWKKSEAYLDYQTYRRAMKDEKK